MATFVDRAVLHLAAGRGGNGCASVHREKFKPLGGPDGGSGGRGGDVILVVDPATTTLLGYHRAPHRRATSGRPGRGSHRNGADGEDLVLPVPSGTVVRTLDGEVLADLVGTGTRFVVAQGGRGGLGNATLATRRRKAPGFALKGEPGVATDVVLELKTVADVGLVGYPNAGKSSLVAALSAARPKIADYPFTTLVPSLGVVTAGDTVFTVADVPGLVPGASAGKGLGLEFLRHVERCAALVHILDCAPADWASADTGSADQAPADLVSADRAPAGRAAAPGDRPGRDPVTDFDVIEAELAAYGDLGGRTRLVVLNKIDVPEARDLAELVRPDLEARGLRVFPVSAATHEGLRELAYAMAEVVAGERAARPLEEPTRLVLRPQAVDDAGFSVVHEQDRFVVRGEKPERWVRQTDFTNDEAVGYLADRLARLGVEQRLVELGADPGAEVIIGEGDDAVVFDWDPALPAGGPAGRPAGRHAGRDTGGHGGGQAGRQGGGQAGRQGGGQASGEQKLGPRGTDLRLRR